MDTAAFWSKGEKGTGKGSGQFRRGEKAKLLIMKNRGNHGRGRENRNVAVEIRRTLRQEWEKLEIRRRNREKSTGETEKAGNPP